MKKKIFIIFALLTIVCASFATVACDKKGDAGDELPPSGDSTGNISSGDNESQTHVHTYSEQWSTDEDNHWRAATCGHDTIADKSAHSFNKIDYLCDVCGYDVSNGFTYEINSDNKSYSVTGLREENGGDRLVIPSEYKGKPVTKIAAEAFSDCSHLTTVVIHSGITDVGASAFSDCDGLTGVYVNDLASWNNIVFHGSFSNPLDYAKKLYVNNELLTNLTIPADLTKINWFNFLGCDDLTGITVDPNNEVYKSDGNCLIDRESNMLLLGCKNSVIPDYVESIGSSAFEGCKDLTEVDIPDGVKSIGFYSFYNCSNLKSVNIPDSVSNISDGAFKNCASLTEISLPSGISSIGRETFSRCSSLTSVEIPYGVTDIGDAAFLFCKSLTSVYIPSTVRNIGSLAFIDCRILTIYCEHSSEQENWQSGWNNNCPVVWEYKNSDIADDGNIYYISQDGLRYALKDGVATLVKQYEYLSGVKTIPATITYKNANYSVTVIESDAFLRCKELTGIVIPQSVTSIKLRAFKGCDNLTIYCEATGKPQGWDSWWNEDDRPVVWGYVND